MDISKKSDRKTRYAENSVIPTIPPRTSVKKPRVRKARRAKGVGVTITSVCKGYTCSRRVKGTTAYGRDLDGYNIPFI